MKILTNRISQMADKILGLEDKIDELEYSNNNRDEIIRTHKKNLRDMRHPSSSLLFYPYPL